MSADVSSVVTSRSFSRIGQTILAFFRGRREAEEALLAAEAAAPLCRELLEETRPFLAEELPAVLDDDAAEVLGPPPPRVVVNEEVVEEEAAPAVLSLDPERRMAAVLMIRRPEVTPVEDRRCRRR